MKVLLHEMSWTEAKKYFSKNDIVILPIGSTEQHGPANPLGTDHMVARAIAEEAARRTGVLCLPVVPFGVSAHHRQFWGTIYVSPRALKEYVREVCLALSYYGVKKIVVVNGHGGNLEALVELARELREKDMFMTVFQWWRATPKLLPELFQADERRHAGAEETSVNLTLHAHLVDMGRAVDEEPRSPIVGGEGVTFASDTVDETDSGVFGKQTTASKQKGKEVLEAAVNELVRHVGRFRKMTAKKLAQKPRV